jgi:hypothetical protein
VSEFSEQNGVDAKGTTLDDDDGLVVQNEHETAGNGADVALERVGGVSGRLCRRVEFKEGSFDASRFQCFGDATSARVKFLKVGHVESPQLSRR